MIVSLLCVPKLADKVLEMSVLTEGEHFGGPLGDKVVSFIGELAKFKGEGIHGLLADSANPCDIVGSKSYQRLEELLKIHQLDSVALMSEAIRQASVGGHRPEEVVDRAAEVKTRGVISRELKQLRTAEAGESDAAKQLELCSSKA